MRISFICLFMVFLGCNQQPIAEPRAQLSKDSVERSDIASPKINSDIEIKSFEDCVKAGYPIMRSLPPQCRTNEGLVFVDKAQLPKIPMPGQRTCEDKCGDGTCDELVCMAVGCPCAETAKTCPSDCGPK